MKRHALSVCFVAAALAAAGLFAASSTDSKTLPIVVKKAERTQQAVKLTAAQQRTLHLQTQQIAHARLDVWGCQDRLGINRSRAAVSVWALPRSIAYRKWVTNRWVHRYTSCRHELTRRSVPFTGDWQTAVRVVQRYYPGTADWLLDISDREGGYGIWVWYGGRPWTGYHIGNDFLGSDTVGGWMQFRFSTFAPYWRAAQADMKRRGYILPDLPMPPAGGDPRYAGWLNPLGQALTAGYMKFYGKEGCHWCL